MITFMVGTERECGGNNLTLRMIVWGILIYGGLKFMYSLSCYIGLYEEQKNRLHNMQKRDIIMIKININIKDK